MSNEQNWITANEAAEVLRLTSRQVHRYGESGKIKTRRAGRRVLFLASDVASLADELQVDHKPAHIIRTEVGTQFLDYFKQRDTATQEILQRQTQAQEQTGQALDRLEQGLAETRRLSKLLLWALVVLIVVVIILVIVVLVR
jgi:hypothetical protein